MIENAALLGHVQAIQIVAQMRQTTMTLTQVAFEAFQQAGTVDVMRQAVQQHPILREAGMIQAIEQAIQTQIPAVARADFLQKLAWLKQIIGEG